MRLVEGRKARELTGLSSDQLREWTGRRGLVSPDLPARGKGSPAKFSWQNILVLRLCMVLRSDFRIELKAHRALLNSMSEIFKHALFHSLFNKRIALVGMKRCVLLPTNQPIDGNDTLVLDLERHLSLIATDFSFQDPVSQLPLFPVVGLRG